jgi:hypothetical protein
MNMNDDSEGFYVISGSQLPFTHGKSYPFTITGDNGEQFEMMAFPVSWERQEYRDYPVRSETRLIAHQVLGRQKP